MGLIYPNKPWRMEDVDIIPYPKEIFVEREVIKEVPVEKIVYKDDPSTLDLLQRTSLEKSHLYLENIELKKRLDAVPVKEVQIERLVRVPVETVVERNIEVVKDNKKKEVVIAVLSCLFGIAICWLMKR